MKHIGRLIRESLLRRKESLGSASRAVFKESKTLSRYANGEAKVTARVFVKLYKYFQIRMDKDLAKEWFVAFGYEQLDQDGKALFAEAGGEHILPEGSTPAEEGVFQDLQKLPPIPRELGQVVATALLRGVCLLRLYTWPTGGATAAALAATVYGRQSDEQVRHAAVHLHKQGLLDRCKGSGVIVWSVSDTGLEFMWKWREELEKYPDLLRKLQDGEVAV